MHNTLQSSPALFKKKYDGCLVQAHDNTIFLKCLAALHLMGTSYKCIYVILPQYVLLFFISLCI